MTGAAATLASDGDRWESVYRSDITTWLAVDANAHRVRVVIVADAIILATCEAPTGPKQVSRLLRFLEQRLTHALRPKLVGRLYDRWPSPLATALVLQYGPVTWVNPNLLNATVYEIERWHRLFKAHRALFYAICAEAASQRDLSPFFDQADLLCAWKNAVLQDLNTNFSV